MDVRKKTTVLMLVLFMLSAGCLSGPGTGPDKKGDKEAGYSAGNGRGSNSTGNAEVVEEVNGTSQEDSSRSGGSADLLVLVGYRRIFQNDTVWLGSFPLGVDAEELMVLANGGNSTLEVDRVFLATADKNRSECVSNFPENFSLPSGGFRKAVLSCRALSEGIWSAEVHVKIKRTEEQVMNFTWETKKEFYVSSASVSPPLRTFYISSSAGNNSNSGRDQTSPWKDFENFGDVALHPGDRILLRRGDVWYEPFEIKGRGSSVEPIVLGAYGEGTPPRLERPWMNGSPLAVIGGENITVKGLELKGGYYTVGIYGSSNITLDGLNISGGFVGVWVQRKDWAPTKDLSNNGTIMNCTIASGYEGGDHYPEDGITLRDGASYWKIHHNLIRDWGHTGIGIDSWNASLPSAYNRIYSNSFSARNSPYMRAFSVMGVERGAHHNRFFHNKIEDTNVRSQIGGHHNIFEQNTIVNVTNSDYVEWPTGQGVWVALYGDHAVSHHNIIRENLFLGCDEACIVLQPTPQDGKMYNIVVSENIIISPGRNSKDHLNGTALFVAPYPFITNNTFSRNIILSEHYPPMISYHGESFVGRKFADMDGANGDRIVVGDISGVKG